MIVPSIDLMEGKAVQLEHGRRKVLERDDVRELAAEFGRVGQLAIIDLDAALGRGDNAELVKELCRIAPAYVGGGIRSRERALEYLRAGAAAVVIGTAASEAFLARLPRSSTIVAVDAAANRVALRGWTERTEESPLDRARRLAPLCAGVLYTAVDREGVFGGADFATAQALRAVVSGTLIVAGGISTIDEIVKLDRMGIDAQVGMALYTGRIDAADAVAALVSFDGERALVPTIVCDAETGRVRMFAYSSAESLRLALREGIGAYYSRSRAAVWVKGETSGNRQELVRIEIDCDRDALCFYVRQRGPTCHTATDRCFGPSSFTWCDLARRIASRAREGNDGSYTRRLLHAPDLLAAKLAEEAIEAAEASSAEDVAWEVADLLYFATVKMESARVSVQDVMAQLRARAS